MLFGGYQPFTLSDYPGCVAAIAFTQGCNFRCRFCHNVSLLSLTPEERSLMTSHDILEKLQDRRGKLGGLVVSGGEPTIQPDLPEFLGQVKMLGFKVKLDTNGSRPDMLAALIHANLLDYIAMDVKAPFDVYARVCGVGISIEVIRESISLISASEIPHHFRTTFGRSLMSDDELDIVRANIPGRSRHVTQTFQPRNALDPLLRQAVFAP